MSIHISQRQKDNKEYGAKDLDVGGAISEKLLYNVNRADHQIENRKGENGKKI